MKQKISILCGIALVLVVRFVSTEAPSKHAKAPLISCLQEGAPQYDEDGFEIINQGPSCKTLESINVQYLQKIKPIFKAKCLMCHGRVSTMPLYVKIPPVSWLITHDIDEAKEHMDMSFDFPFQGHGSAKDDLEKMRGVIQKNEMPPLRYKIMHWQSSLTEKEIKVLLEWVQESLKTLTGE